MRRTPRAKDYFEIHWRVPLGYFDHEGFLYLLKRVDEMMNNLLGAPLLDPSRMRFNLEHLIEYEVEALIMKIGVDGSDQMEFDIVPRVAVEEEQDR